MLEELRPQPADKIIEMIGLYKADTREGKMDLGVGVYKNDTGETPIMRSVKEAEKRLVQNQNSKSYVALAGQVDFVNFMREMSLADSVSADRVAGIQTPGGTGAIRQLYELIRMANPNAKIWVSDPSWPNHVAILKYLGMPHREYAYFDRKTCTVNFDAMLHDLDTVSADDVVILHGCCHNPTGANLTPAQWEIVADHLNTRGALAMVDIAYQGFGDGLEADAAGLRILASKMPELLVAQSCSKNFGVYRDRVGAAFAISRTEEQAKLAQVNLNTLNRLNYSFPPDHGASVLMELASDAKLIADWKDELESMRLEMLEKRKVLSAALRRETNSDRFDFIEHHRGMFSLTGISSEAVLKLREEHAIYMVHDSRMNIAGLQLSRVDHLAKAIASVI